MNVLIIIGARPNYPKLSVVMRAIKKLKTSTNNLNVEIVHTGQHFDREMSDKITKELDIEIATQFSTDKNLDSSFRLSELLWLMTEFLRGKKFSFAIVFGDVHTAVAACLIAKVNEIKIIHVESGLLSGFNDPEEFNRCLISNISDYHLCPSITAYSNLLSEGINKQKIFLVGNTMAEACILTHEKYKDDGRWKDFVLFTVHKAYNSSKINQIKEMLTTLAEIEKIIFPVHPSIKNQFNDFYHKNVEKIPPLSYIEMNKMISSVKYIVTDSAGLQEESTVLGVPCYTIGNQTARPETCINGTNTLIGYSVKKILENQKLEKNTSIPLFWDKNVNTRIEKAFRKIFYEANKEN